MSNQTVIRVLPDRNKIKPFYKKWWFWLIIFLVALVIFAAIISENKKKQTEDNNSVETTQTEMSEMDYKSSCKTIDYKTLARNPNKYKGDHFKITGEVEQVIEEDNVLDDNTQYTVRLNMTKNDLDYWDDTILLNVEIPQDEDRILEDDIITVYGTCQGKYTYTGLLKSSVTVPLIDVKYFNINTDDNQSVWANKTTSFNDFNYYIDSNEIIIKEYKGNDDKIKISSTYTIDGKKRKVTSFSDAVFIFDSVESVILPNGTKHLEANMFNSCGIKYLYIPKTVKSVDDYFWDYFHNMEKIYYQGTEKEWKKLCKVDRSEIDVKEIIYNTDSSKLK